MPYKGKVLLDHLRKGSSFLPPFACSFGDEGITQVDWRADILPELIWIGLLVEDIGFSRSKEITCVFAFIADQVSTYGKKGNYGLISGFRNFNDSEKERIRDMLGKAGILEILQHSLDPLYVLYEDCPLAFLFPPTYEHIDDAESVRRLGPILDECLFRRSKLPTLVQGIYYEILLYYGKLIISGKVSRYDTMLLLNYPDTEESEHIAGHMRCCATSIPMESEMESEDGGKSKWPEYFWKINAQIGDCEPHKPDGVYPNDLPHSFNLYTMELFRDYHEKTDQIWKEIQEKYNYDVYWAIRDDILLGLASKIYRTTIQIVSFIPNWTDDFGQVYLRTIVESYIYYAWLSEHGTKKDFEKFYEYGLGQRKLASEHTKAYMQENGISKEEAERVVDSVDYLRNHKLPDFVTVNVGSPLGKDLRKLADEIDQKEVYALLFSPTSSMVHGMYDSLDQFFLRICLNPFHCRHRIPYYWYKSQISTYAVTNSLSICDWVISDLMTKTGIPSVEKMPGIEFIEGINDAETFDEFASREEIVAQCDAFDDALREHQKKHQT